MWIRASPDDLEFPLPGPGASRIGICGTDLKEISEIDVALTSSKREGSDFTCDLEFRNIDPRALKDSTRLWHLNDQTGRQYEGYIRSRRWADPNVMGYGLVFNGLPADAVPAMLSVSLPRRVVALEVPFSLRDIPLK